MYYKGTAGGHFTITATSTDATSGVNFAFPALGTGWSSTGTGASRVYTFTTTATSSGTETVTATNNAGSATSATFVLADDVTAPTVSAPSYVLTQAVGASLTITIGTVTDSGSGVASTVLKWETATLTGTTCGGYGGGFTHTLTVTGSTTTTMTTTSNTCYQFETTATDQLGNTVTTASGGVLKVS